MPFAIWKSFGLPRASVRLKELPVGKKAEPITPLRKSRPTPAAILGIVSTPFVVIVLPAIVHAHGVQEARYSPPIPGWLFLVGGGLAVALSFFPSGRRIGGR